MTNNLAHKKLSAGRRAQRVRAKLSGTAERPRLAVHVSNLHVTAQLIDDEKGQTIAYVTTVGQKVSGTLSDKSAWVGEQIAKAAAKKNVKRVAFDRAAKKYHGRVSRLATAARETGLEF